MYMVDEGVSRMIVVRSTYFFTRGNDSRKDTCHAVQNGHPWYLGCSHIVGLSEVTAVLPPFTKKCTGCRAVVIVSPSR